MYLYYSSPSSLEIYDEAGKLIMEIENISGEDLYRMLLTFLSIIKDIKIHIKVNRYFLMEVLKFIGREKIEENQLILTFAKDEDTLQDALKVLLKENEAFFYNLSDEAYDFLLEKFYDRIIFHLPLFKIVGVKITEKEIEELEKKISFCYTFKGEDYIISGCRYKKGE